MDFGLTGINFDQNVEVEGSLLFLVPFLDRYHLPCEMRPEALLRFCEGVVPHAQDPAGTVEVAWLSLAHEVEQVEATERTLDGNLRPWNKRQRFEFESIRHNIRTDISSCLSPHRIPRESWRGRHCP